MKYNEIIVATSNDKKIIEIQSILDAAHVDIKVKLLPKGITPPDENGLTYQDNALIKATYYAQHVAGNILSEDSGFVIPDLQGYFNGYPNEFPGIYSARFFTSFTKPRDAYDAIYNATINKYQRTNLKAKFVCYAVLYDHQNLNYIHANGEITGSLSFPPRGMGGFGYDPIFIPDGYHQTFAEMGAEQKNHISHRYLAIQNMLQKIGVT